MVQNLPNAVGKGGKVGSAIGDFQTGCRHSLLISCCLILQAQKGTSSPSGSGWCREKGEELRAAVEEWQTKRAVPEPRLTTGFLDGIQPIVDSYELKVPSQLCTTAF